MLFGIMPDMGAVSPFIACTDMYGKSLLLLIMVCQISGILLMQTGSDYQVVMDALRHALVTHPSRSKVQRYFHLHLPEDVLLRLEGTFYGEGCWTTA